MKNAVVAERFAKSLDEEDYDVTAECLAEECRYYIAGDEHQGREAVIASYKKAGDWASKTLDAIGYESRVRSDDGRLVVEFVDHLEHAGQKLTHRCEQHLEFDAEGRICKITHVDLPGEKAAVDLFLKSVGLVRPAADNEV